MKSKMQSGVTDKGASDSLQNGGTESAVSITRRTLLKSASWLAAAAAVPLGSRAAAAIAPGDDATQEKPPAENSQVITQLSSYMAAAAERELPVEVMEEAKQHILDTFAAMVSGADLPAAKVAFKFAEGNAGSKVATVVGSTLVCGPIEAALTNGMLAHSDETDDSHAPSHSHPGCGIVPAALASAEYFAISGTRFLRAVTLGYDIGTRVTMTFGGLPYQMATHHSNHSVANTFGAGAAAGSSAGLDAQQMKWILDYAAQQASGVAAWQRDTQHIEKSLVFAGFPARNGVSSALLIHFGGTGVEDILSGADNFLLAFAPKADPAGLIEKLGERYEITRTSIKKWTVGSPIQAPLDAMENMRKRRAFDADQVQKVNVHMAISEAHTVNNRDMPDICLQHMMAVMLLDKTASFKSAHDRARMKDPAILRERAKIQLVPDEALEKLYPLRATILEVVFKDGTTMTERVNSVRGTAENPMTTEEVTSKARDLMTPFLGAEKCKQLIEAIFNLEKMGDMRGLRPLLQRS